MLPALLAAFFFALNSIYSNRNVRAHGPAVANVGRLLVATAVLGLFAHTLGHGFASASTGWFFLSGVIGMGIGDLGVYAALPLLGARLTVLMTQCLAAPIAAIGEWLWLGTQLTVAQMAWGLVVLAGVALALVPSKAHPPRVAVKPAGFLFGVLAAAGQGLGALVSRKGSLVASAAGESAENAVFGLNAAYQRILAGLVFAAAWFFILHLLRSRSATAAPAASEPVRPSLIAANGLIGPVLGVGCYQWALATTPSGIVLPLAAMTPLLAIPIAWRLEGDRPTARALAGSLVAVGGCIALTLAR